jgi:hypothetical protein
MGFEWRNHPKLKGHFHRACPDDTQVMIHDGGPRFSSAKPEVVWVTVTSMDGDLFTGKVVSKPAGIRSVGENSTISFLAVDGSPVPVLVTDKYLKERQDWDIKPCDKCGLTEMFDAPSDLFKLLFPEKFSDLTTSIFTPGCPLCKGIQEVKSKNYREKMGPNSGKSPKKAWEFWKK